jgi:hypothetical protein
MEKDYLISISPVVFSIYNLILIIFHIYTGFSEGWKDLIIAGMVVSSLMLIYGVYIIYRKIENKKINSTSLPSSEIEIINKKLDKLINTFCGISITLFFAIGVTSSVLFFWRLENFELFTKILIFLWCVPTAVVLLTYALALAFYVPCGLLYGIFKCLTYKRYG